MLIILISIINQDNFKEKKHIVKKKTYLTPTVVHKQLVSNFTTKKCKVDEKRPKKLLLGPFTKVFRHLYTKFFKQG